MIITTSGFRRTLARIARFGVVVGLSPRGFFSSAAPGDEANSLHFPRSRNDFAFSKTILHQLNPIDGERTMTVVREAVEDADHPGKVLLITMR
ncbi:MAG: hypothetical protein ACRCZF_26875 [Gemmataceae bacterium]